MQNELLKIKNLVKNVEIKLSAASSVTSGEKRQILCIVTTLNEIIIRYVSEIAEISFKKVSWFQESNKTIQAISIDPNSEWLLILCLDNTLHIAPVLSIVDKAVAFKCIFSPHEITSFVIPFIGPHECPNTQKCPNHQQMDTSDPTIFDKTLKRNANKNHQNVFLQQQQSSSSIDNKKDNFSTTKVNEFITSNAIYNTFYCDQQPNTSLSTSSSFSRSDLGKCDNPDFNILNDKNISTSYNNNNTSKSTTPGQDSQILSASVSSIMEASTGSESTLFSSCPIPTAVTWWKTQNDENRAILGYSDGFIVVVLLANNCPFIGNTVIEKGCIEKLTVCRDNSLDVITLMINTIKREQYKMLLEQKSTSYVFPNELRRDLSESRHQRSESESEWEVVTPTASAADLSPAPFGSNTDSEQNDASPSSNDEAMSKLFPAAKARLLSLRDLGAKKIGNLKLKLAESRIRARERERIKDQTSAAFAMINSPTATPELLTTPSGPYFIVQTINNKNLLSALHSYSDTLSIHSIDITLIPSSLYKLPAHSKNVLMTESFLYAHQVLTHSPLTITASTPVNANEKEITQRPKQSESIEESSIETVAHSNSMTDLGTSTNTATTNSSQDDDNLNNNEPGDTYENTNTLSVISSALAGMKIGDDFEFPDKSLLGTFKFREEKILNIHWMTSVEKDPPQDEDQIVNDNTTEIKSTYSKYLNLQKNGNAPKFTENDKKVLRNQFPSVAFNKCLVVTDKNVYSIELKDKPHIMFLSLANASQWGLCDDFCKTFNLNLAECVEFAGDVFLKKKRIEQALLTYNIARIPPIKTALKLAMFNECNALRQITSMALKISYILESKHPMNPLINIVTSNAKERHEKSDVIFKLLRNKESLKHENTGKIISDFSYSNEENSYEIQMSNSAQFHLSNLLFLTLCEKCVRDKNYMPLWNFIVANNKYHTSLSSIILSQSGLYSTAILLAMHRGACLDVFSCLVSTSDHVLDISEEMKVFMYNLSDEIFMETIVYLQNYSLDYFEIIRANFDKFDETVLERLEKQLNPFDAIYRPILFKVKHQNVHNGKEMENKFIEFCRTLIETYILILIKLRKLRTHNDSFLNALNNFRVNSEERQNYVKLINYSPLSAGFSQSGCIVDSCVYLWGSNGVNCALSKSVLQNDTSELDILPTRVEFFRDVNLEVYSVHCGRSHTLFLTNNGLYAMGLNTLGQLGIDRNLNQALQPMLVKGLDNKIITQICVGQHHNAVVADGVLYTWGWNIYGQLGHCDITTVREPKVVEFFRNKKIKQISLGQAHTLVLTYEKCRSLSTCLYVFGSNHYGQLGQGIDENSVVPTKKNLSISAVPIRLEFEENLRLIHTQYFTSYAVTDSNKLLTWGLSPPELRIINQTKKRAKASQKLKESMKVEAAAQEELSKSKAILNETIIDNNDEEVVKEEEKDGMQEVKLKVPEIKIDECSPPGTSSILASAGSETKESDDPNAPIEEYTEHLSPTDVDTFELDGDIIYLSSGIYHSALITTRSSLYMWGKNIERQLGRENVKPDDICPTRQPLLDDVKFVECGADFTLAIKNNNELVAFGNNNSGQCGCENQNEKNAGASKLIRFKSSKRVFRIPESSLYIHKPVSVKIPTYQTSVINFSTNQPIAYLKNLPKFKRNSLIESPLSQAMRKSGNSLIDYENSFNNNKNSSLTSISSIGSTASSSSKSSVDSGEETEEQLKRSNDFIHYCLYLFQGLYDEQHLCDYQSQKSGEKIGNEYKIRACMLRYNYIEAFKLSLLNHCSNAQISIKIFEYFTTDSNIIPMHTEDIKYFIYDIFLHFIRNNLDIMELEKYLMNNMDYYLLQLTFILYFSGNNNNNQNNNIQNGLEKQLFDKFKHLYSNYENFSYFDSTDTEQIFKSISTKFNCVLCQNLLKYSENFN